MEEVFSVTEQDRARMKAYGLDPEKLRGCSVRTYYFGEQVITEGQPIDHIFLVTDGKAKVGTMAPNGKNLILCFYVCRGLLGDLELCSDTSLGNSTVTALIQFRCVAIPTDCNRDYLFGNLAFIRTAAFELSKKLRQHTEGIVANTFYPAEIRLCRYILDAADKLWFRDIMTDVACSVGVSYRHLYRMMGTLCREGILEKTASGYRICKPDVLAERCRAQ